MKKRILQIDIPIIASFDSTHVIRDICRKDFNLNTLGNRIFFINNNVGTLEHMSTENIKSLFEYILRHNRNSILRNTYS
jgi:hypothetical protein